MGATATPAPPLPHGGGLDTQLFRSLFFSYPDSLLLVDPAGTIVLSNPGAARLLGYSQDELRGMAVDALVPLGARSGHAAQRQRYAAAPRPRPMGTHMELSARRKDGSEVMVEIALSPLQGDGLPYVVAAIRDIGGYPRVQQVLRRARYSEHLAQLGRLAVDARDPQVVLDQVPAVAADALQLDVAMVYLLQSNGVVLSLASGVGLMHGESVGMPLTNPVDTLPGWVLRQGRAAQVPDLRSEQRFIVPAAYLAAGLKAALALPLSDRGHTVGTLAVYSRSAQAFGEDEVRFLESLCNLLATCLQRARSEDALKHAQRLETVGQLTGGIAHDFNNLLTVIRGNLQVLEDLPAMADDAYGQHLVAAATRASQRGAELTGKLLAFSRRQVLQPSAVDVNQLVNSLADTLRRTLDQRIRIEVQEPRSCPPVLADAGQLEAALLNIAINARDAMREGGTLSFRAEACAALPAAVRSSLDDAHVRDDAFVAITIRDTGSGMTEAVKRRAFEPFFTTKEAGRGTGLGLSTVYGFVKQSKGAVGLESAPDAGTTLTLYLPRSAHADVASDSDTPAGQALAEGLKVLLVEDDADVREVVRDHLETLRCRVTLAASGEQALLALGPDACFDLLLSDIALGAGMRGTQLAALAQQRLPNMAVLLMSGYSSELLHANREAPSSWELLRKPYTRSELAAAIAKLVKLRHAAG
jgi:PAS domain S-box-containing protein